MSYRIALLPGDGVGAVILAEAAKLPEALRRSLDA
jgi:isocitrate/isopropylmalate dehydrogenase